MRAVLPLEDEERSFIQAIRDAGGPLDGPVLTRVDTNAPLGAARFRARLVVYEVNGVGVGGLHYAPGAERVVLSGLPDAERRRYRPLADLIAAFEAALRAMGRRAAIPVTRVALCEDTTDGTGTTEFHVIAETLTRRGLPACVTDLRDLSVLGGRIVNSGGTVDLLYRDTEIRDLLSLGLPASAMQAWRLAFEQGRVLSGPAGDLDHKSLLEVLTDDLLSRAVPSAERKLLRQHALWTRLLSDRRTQGPDGHAIDLVPYARRRRQQLVIKPNRRYGGKDVTLGPFVSDRAWDRALGHAVEHAGTNVLQRYAPMARDTFPDLLHVDAGLILVGRALGILSRAARDPIVNIARGGGLAPVVRRAR
jgi:hypothetical protein